MLHTIELPTLACHLNQLSLKSNCVRLHLVGLPTMTSNVYVLDGGLGTELQRQGHNAESDKLFGSSLLLQNPQAIYEVHMSYLQSGSDIITSATYQVSIDNMVTVLQISPAEAKSYIQKAVHIARNACNQFWTKHSGESNHDRCEPKVAGSIGPYGASLADGSEYHGSYSDTMTKEELKEWHRPRFQCLVETGVDFIAMETIPAVKEGEALIELLQEFPSTKAWLSFSCKNDQQTCHGEYFSDAIRQCLMHDHGNQLMAVGVNCTKPLFVKSLLQRGQHYRGHVPFIAYPNSGETWTTEKKWQGKENCVQISALVKEWIALGARYVGGCCRVTPEDIKEMFSGSGLSLASTQSSHLMSSRPANKYFLITSSSLLRDFCSSSNAFVNTLVSCCKSLI